jgi:excisionase family DNA binding protein
MPKGFLPTIEVQANRFITPKELASLLRLSEKSIYRLVERRLLPFYRISGSLRFDHEDIEAFIKQGKVEPLGRRA